MEAHADADIDGDVDSITQLVADAGTYQSDVNALMALHRDDTIIVNFVGRRVLGRSAFRDAMQQALEGPMASVLTTVDVEDIRFVTPDVAIVSCTKTIRDERGDSSNPLPTSGAMSYVVAREPRGWRIALAQTTPILS